jgi:hypothetical protein
MTVSGSVCRRGEWGLKDIATYVRVRRIDHDAVKLHSVLLCTPNGEFERFGSSGMVEMNSNRDTSSMRAGISDLHS